MGHRKDLARWQLPLEASAHAGGVDSDSQQHGRGDSALLLNEGEKDVLRGNVRALCSLSLLLRQCQGALTLSREAFPGIHAGPYDG